MRLFIRMITGKRIFHSNQFQTCHQRIVGRFKFCCTAFSWSRRSKIGCRCHCRSDLFRCYVLESPFAGWLCIVLCDGLSDRRRTHRRSCLSGHLMIRGYRSHFCPGSYRTQSGFCDFMLACRRGSLVPTQEEHLSSKHAQPNLDWFDIFPAVSLESCQIRSSFSLGLFRFWSSA